MSNNILLVCTDTLESQLLVMALERVGLAVTVVADLDGKRPSPPDLIVLVNHDGHYLATARRLRQEFSAPLLLLTDFHREEEHISALQEGVDLIFFRPYSIRFLAVQIPALLWRLMPPAPSVPMENGPDILSGPFSGPFSGHVHLNPATQTLHVRDRPAIRLSQLEFRLLHILLLHPQQVLDTQTLVERVWGYSGEGDSKLVRQVICRLRAKLNDNGRDPRFIHTIPNVGYSFHDGQDAWRIHPSPIFIYPGEIGT